MDKLGIQLPLILAQVVNFAILMFILSKFLYKPVMKKLSERREKIAAGLTLTESLKVKEEELVKKEAAILKKAQAEAAKLVAAAKKEAKVEQEKLLANTKADLARQRLKFQSELAAESMATKKALAKESLTIAQTMAAKLLTDILDPAAQHKLISKSITQLEKDHDLK